MTREILIVGTSARAAAQSTIRAGWRPFAIDQFADEDLLACCRSRRVDDYPQGIVALASQFPDCPFLYTGALENHPEAIAALARARPLLGNPADVVRAVRDPWTLCSTLAQQGLPTPEIRRAGESLPPGQWLSKPFRSGAGIGIRRIKGVVSGPTMAGTSTGTHYHQRYVAGEPISALYVAARGQASLLGATRQLVGCEWAGADHFLYVGNMGPIAFPFDFVRQLQQIGDVLAREFQLVGLFGVDGILNGTDVTILEVNPRYTAAVEILERSLDLPAIRLHLEACERHRLPSAIVPGAGLEPHGKAILYARHSIVVPREFSQWVARLNADSRYPVVADLPAAGSTIIRGAPVCTIFATASTETALVDSLQHLAHEAFAVVEIGRVEGP